ncbi:hypothetical protein L593_13680 [Salinarchaeum sp. Harcht-Bsk1]|nr:hypothetical protein L593_13680 [Salinarchaeum sp. Harcht-Bsk1]
MVFAGAGVAILLVAVAAGGGAAAPAEEPLVNGSVNITDAPNQSVYVDVEFAADANLDAYLFDPAGNETANASISSTTGSIGSHSFVASQNGTYRVEVYGNASDVSAIWVGNESDTSENATFVGGATADDGSSSNLWIVAAGLAFTLMLAAVGVVARSRW